MNADAAKPWRPAAAPFWSWLQQAPLFHAAWLFAVGITISAFVWIPPAPLLMAAVAMVALAIAAGVQCVRLAWLPAAILTCLLGAWCAEMEPHPSPSPDLLRMSDRLARTVEGSVIATGPLRDPEQVPDSEEGEVTSQRVDVRLSSIEFVDDNQDVQKPVDGTMRLTVRWGGGLQATSVLPFRCGEHIRAVVRLARPQTYHDPGVWNRADYLIEQGVTSVGTVDVEEVERQGTVSGGGASCRIAEFQQWSGARLLSLSGAMQKLPAWLRITPEDGVMLSAMVTGDRTFLAHSLRVGFERTGSFHMLVVSGLHLAIVSGWVMWLLRILRMPRVATTLVTMAASIAYALFTGFATPVQRSLWMVLVYLVGTLVFRQRSALNTIGFAALCLLAVSPRSLLESSFQMTLLAVVAIAGIASPLLEQTVQPYSRASRQLDLTLIDAKVAPRVAQFRVILRMFAERLQRLAGRRVGWRVFPSAVRFLLRVGELVVVTVIIEMVMTLPMALYFHRITLMALPVNVLILPLLVVLMPVALLTWIGLLLWPAIAVIPATITAVLLHCGLGMVHLFGSLAWGDFRIPTPHGWQAASFCVLLTVAIALARSGQRWVRRTAIAALAGAAAAAVMPIAVQHPHDALVFEAIDVGQGDSMLVVTPEGKTLLVDGGGLGGAPRTTTPEFDVGEEVVSMALWSRGIQHLDVVALSHAHSDHMGGLSAVLRNFRPKELWVGDNPPSPAYRALLAEAAEMHTRVRSLRAGDEVQLGDVRIDALAPLPEYYPGQEPQNNDSLVLHLAYGATSVLMEGDAEEPIEQGMLREDGLQSTLLKVGHHGSTSSTRPEFLARVAPQWAVISCGYQNRYGQPRPEVLEELQAGHVHTFSTDINGATCFHLDGRTVTPVPWCMEQR